jgi:hypothetical protein
VSAGVEQCVLGGIEADDAFAAAVLLLLFIFAGSRFLGFYRLWWRGGVNRPLRRLWRLGRGLNADGAVAVAVAGGGGGGQWCVTDVSGGRVGHAGGVLEQQLVFGIEEVAAAGAVSTSLVVPRPSTKNLVSRNMHDTHDHNTEKEVAVTYDGRMREERAVRVVVEFGAGAVAAGLRVLGPLAVLVVHHGAQATKPNKINQLKINKNKIK